MKRTLPWIVTLVVAAGLASSLFRRGSEDARHLEDFGRLPVLLNGRIKPLDTVARTSLLAIHDKQSLRTEDGARLSAIEWFAELAFAPAKADERRVFTIHDPQVLSLFGWSQDDKKYFSFDQLRPYGQEVVRQAQLAGPIEAQKRSLFQRHILELYQQMERYHRLKNSLQVPDSPDFAREIRLYAAAIPAGVSAMNEREAGEAFDQSAFDAFMTFAARYREMSEMAYIRVIPPAEASAEDNRGWLNVGESLIRASMSGRIHPVVTAYAEAGRAYRAGDTAAFTTAVNGARDWITEREAPEMRMAGLEVFFNEYAPFYKALVIYVLVFVLACISWLTGPGVLRRTAFLLTGLAFLIHTSGIIFRMSLEGRPPVTNLYSSAVFVGWAAVLLGLVLERLYRNGVGSVVSGLIGFSTLVVAHNLVLVSGGDTMEMMRAVLDSNFWLSTHVVAITVGYSATFLAGFLAVVYIVLGVGTRLLDRPFTRAPGGGARTETNADAIGRMVYGIVCFATFFSFVGTVLGGIWADQSWGRFWGWDPKENGAALIVLWNAIILHARWGGYIRQRGLMVMAVFGNIVTAWSWFGTNMLGVGLHSYGFMDKAFNALVGFWISQLLVMALGAIPLERWRSTAVARRAARPAMAPAATPLPERKGVALPQG